MTLRVMATLPIKNHLRPLESAAAFVDIALFPAVLAPYYLYLGAGRAEKFREIIL